MCTFDLDCISSEEVSQFLCSLIPDHPKWKSSPRIIVISFVSPSLLLEMHTNNSEQSYTCHSHNYMLSYDLSKTSNISNWQIVHNIGKLHAHSPLQIKAMPCCMGSLTQHLDLLRITTCLFTSLACISLRVKSHELVHFFLF